VPCLDDQVVLRFVSGALDAAGRSEVEAELARCARCAALVAAIARQHDVEAAPPERYELGSVIARGGMGTIVGAFDRRLGRSIAVKRLDAASSTARARFDREIAVTAALQHPNIVPIYDAGELADGRPFYAMRHVPGHSFDHAIAAATTREDRFALLGPIVSAADAVAYAHQRGVVHRDLKPLNILVGPFGETVVIDWGLAKVAHDVLPPADSLAEGTDPGATRDGAILGTPRYMSPEQARGEVVTASADVYALGAILYHALGGVAAIDTGGDASDAIARLAAGRTVRLGKLAPDLPRDLVAIVDRAMALSAADRYGDAGELAADLRRFQTGQLVTAYRYSRPDRIRRFGRRHRIAVGVATIAIAAIAAIGVTSVLRIIDERDAAGEASARAETQRGRADHARAGAEELVQFMVSDLRKTLGTIGRFDVLTGVADRVDAYLASNGDPHEPATMRARARVLEVRAAVADGTGDPKQAERYAQQARQLVDDSEAIEPSIAAKQIRAALVVQQGVRATAAGDDAAALVHYREAADIWRGIPNSDAMLAATLASVGETSDRRSQPEAADAAWREATAILERALARTPDDSELRTRQALIWLSRGQSKARHGDMPGAERDLTSALDAADRAASAPHATNEIRRVTVMALDQLADARSALGKGDVHPFHVRAAELVHAALAIEASNTKWRAELARSFRELARDANAAGDAGGARELLAEASAEYERLVAINRSDRRALRAAAIAASELALATRDPANARPAVELAVAHFDELARPGDAASQLDLAFMLRQAAAVERRSGHLAVAATRIARALAIVAAEPGAVPVHAYYRAAVLGEAANIDARGGHYRDAAGHRAERARIVADLAKRGQLQPDWRADLEDAK
jgi:tetratricopeptide (TPR) repeat protein